MRNLWGREPLGSGTFGVGNLWGRSKSLRAMIYSDPRNLSRIYSDPNSLGIGLKDRENGILWPTFH